MTNKQGREKGKDYERELAKEIEQRLGGRVWRSPSSGAMWYAKQDVVCQGNIMQRFHLEAKRQERVNLEDAFGQALRGAGQNKVPIVVTRKSRDVSMVYMKFDDFLTLLEELQGGDHGPS